MPATRICSCWNDLNMEEVMMWLLTIHEKMDVCSKLFLFWFVAVAAQVIPSYIGSMILMAMCVILIEVAVEIFHILKLERKGYITVLL